MSDGIELTAEEEKAIRALKRLEKTWPKTLWLFSNGVNISVMRCGNNGEHVMYEESSGGVHKDYIVDTVCINNDGGGW